MVLGQDNPMWHNWCHLNFIQLYTTLHNSTQLYTSLYNSKQLYSTFEEPQHKSYVSSPSKQMPHVKTVLQLDPSDATSAVSIELPCCI
jgi:hypothetical protein